MSDGIKSRNYEFKVGHSCTDAFHYSLLLGPIFVGNWMKMQQSDDGIADKQDGVDDFREMQQEEELTDWMQWVREKYQIYEDEAVINASFSERELQVQHFYFVPSRLQFCYGPLKYG